MKRTDSKVFVVCCVVVALCAIFVAAKSYFSHPTSRAIAKVGDLPDFSLIDHKGEIHRLYQYADAKFLVITAHGNGCPIIQKYSLKLNEMRDKYAARGVEFLLLNSNQEDDRKSVMKEAEDYAVRVPILLDSAQLIAKLLGFTRTSETVVIDPRQWKIVYRGPINDQLDYGVDKQRARNEYLEDALDQLLAGRSPSGTPPAAKGCLISFREKKEISYSKDIAPILADKCMRCHGSPARFPPEFKGIDTVRSWAAMIKETILTDRMPPFSADPLYGPYENDPSLTPEEKFLLVEWINRGSATAPDEPDPLAEYKRPKKKRAKLLNSKPIYSVQMAKPAVIPPRGEVEYKYFQLGDAIPEDMWIHSVHVTSTNPRQLHHESLMVTPKPLKFYEDAVQQDRDEDKVSANKDGDIPLYTLWKMMRTDGKDPNYVRIQVWAAGRRQPFGFGKSGALFLPKGYYLTLETHYMGTGREETEQTTIDFYGERKKGQRRAVRTLLLSALDLEIPPNEKKYSVASRPYKVHKDSHIRSLLGHMHMRGRAIRAVLKTPDGNSRTVASIPNFYYGWQTGAGLVPNPPIFVPKGSELTGVCEFDNSAQNPYNPDPSKTVYHGQTHDRSEMCHFNLQMMDAN